MSPSEDGQRRTGRGRRRGQCRLNKGESLDALRRDLFCPPRRVPLQPASHQVDQPLPEPHVTNAAVRKL